MKIEDEILELLERRNVKEKEEPFELEGNLPVLWSFKKGKFKVIAVKNISKLVASSIVESIGDDKCILIYTLKCTPVASSLLKNKENIELWSEEELCVQNPFKFNFICDAGIVENKENKIFEIESDYSKLPKIKKTDPLARHLGANLGQIVWISFKWGTMEPETKFRYVI
jgi:DNA-directed RNA polymerase subunit H (RpoH/RPB5)